MIDQKTEKCFNLPPSDPESFKSNMFYMNTEWVQFRCQAIKYPGHESVVQIMKRIEGVKKVIADEEKLNDLQILDGSHDEQLLQKIVNCVPHNNTIIDLASIITGFDALLKGKDKTCAVFFPLLCKNTAMLNFAYAMSDVFSRPIEPEESPKFVHSAFFLHSVLVYHPKYAWRSVLLNLADNSKNGKTYEMMFRQLLQGYNDECCICTDSFSKHVIMASICPHCASPYCTKCTKKLKKGRRKRIICVYCKQTTINCNDITKNTTGN